MYAELMQLWNKLTICCSQESWVCISEPCNGEGGENRKRDCGFGVTGGGGGGNQAHADKPLSLKTGLMVLCLFGWRQDKAEQNFSFLTPSVDPGRWESPACAPGQWPTDWLPWPQRMFYLQQKDSTRSHQPRARSCCHHRDELVF